MLCPECLSKGVTNKLFRVGIKEEIYFCENNDCTYYSSNTITGLKSKKRKRYSTKDPDISIDNILKEIDLSEDEMVDIMDNTYKNFDHTFKSTSLKRQMYGWLKIADRQCGFFNWFILPLMLKFHIKIFYFFRINLNLFDTVDNETVTILKKSFYQSENLALQVLKCVATILSFDFAKEIYSDHKNVSIPISKDLNVMESFKKCVNIYLEKKDPNCKLKARFKYEENCDACSNFSEYTKEDYFIKLGPHQIESDSYNTFNFRGDCKKCMGHCTVTITIESCSNFVFLEFPNGMNNEESFEMVNRRILNSQKPNEMRIQAVIEMEHPVGFIDISNKAPEISDFTGRNIAKSVLKYNIHFRNYDDWYHISNKSDHIISPQSNIQTDSINWENVKLVVMAPVYNPDKGELKDKRLSVTDQLIKFKDPPPNTTVYPKMLFKYYLFCFQCRDYCLQFDDFNSKLLDLISTKMSEKLNNYWSKMRRKTELKPIESNKKSKKRKLPSSSSISGSSEDCNGVLDSVSNESTKNKPSGSWKKIDFKHKECQTLNAGVIGNLIRVKKERIEKKL